MTDDSKPSACIQRYGGYHLYQGKDQQPVIFRRWTRRRKGEEDEPVEDRFTRFEELPQHIRFEIEGAWKQWVDWREAMKP